MLESLKNSNSYIYAFIIKTTTWLFSIAIGVMVNISYQMGIQKKRLGWVEVFAIMSMACFVGYWSDRLVTIWHYDQYRGLIVSLSAMLSKDIIQYLFQNWRGYAEFIYKSITKKKDND